LTLSVEFFRARMSSSSLEIGDIELKFNVGAQKATVYLPLDTHANDFELVRHFLSTDGVPAYLHGDIASALSTLHSMALSETALVPDDAALLLDLSSCLSHGAALARVLARTHRKPSSQQGDDLNGSIVAMASSAGSGAAATNDDDDTRFVDAYENISRVPYAAREVRQLEQSYAAALAELQQSKLNALATLHKRQSAEMESLIARSGDAPAQAVERLVAKHVAEVSALERRWDDEFDASKRQQRADYRADVINLYSEMQRRRGEIVTLFQKPSVDGSAIALTGSSTASPRVSSGGASASPAGTPTSTKEASSGTNKIAQKLGSIISFGRRTAATVVTATAAVAPPIAQSIAASVASAAAADAAAAGGGGGGGANANEPHIERFRIHLGSQRKNPYMMELMTGDVLDCVRGAERGDSLSSVYSDSLSAVVVLVDAGLKFTSKQCQEFASLCNASTEFHFAPLEQQLDAVRAEAAVHGALRPGEFFVTRHSTLNGAHVVFHFVTGDNSSTASAKSPLLFGLRNMLALAVQYDVTTLTLPVLLVDRGVEAMMTEAVMLKRAQSILFTIKGALQQNCSMDNPLKTIRLVSPGKSESLFKKYAEILA
jgi:hypothetical protein